jgi:hypothetical protein
MRTPQAKPSPVHIQVSVNVHDGTVYIQHDIDNETSERLNEDGALRIAFTDLPYLIAILQKHAAAPAPNFGRYDIPQPANGDAFTKACDDTGGVG